MSDKKSTNISIPYNFIPRSYQLDLLSYLDKGGNSGKRAVIVWHRRAGKEKTSWNYTICAACRKVGSYYYFFPTNVQARKVLWDGMDASGFKFLDHIPKPLIDGQPNQTEMKIRLKNGSILQILGTDNYDSVRGTNPIGCVFSEYSYQDPRAWDTFRPILTENKGWAIFNFTSNGRNHAHELYYNAKSAPNWFTQILTINDTKREDGTPVISAEDIENERAAGMDEEMISQEYYCSFTGITVGSYYGKLMEKASEEGRIGAVPYETRLPVDTWWDLGIGDATAIWFTQTHGRTIRVIDYYENSGEGLAHYIKYLRDKPYVYGIHNAPHDIEVRELGTGKSRLEVAESLGLRFNVIEKLSVEDGIQAVRDLIPLCWFDKDKCREGISSLYGYHKEWDDKRAVFKTTPFHDRNSHGADSFRYLSVGHKFLQPIDTRPKRYIRKYNQGTASWMAK